MRFPRRRRGEPARDGCGYLLLTCLFTCLLLVLNCIAVARFQPLLLDQTPGWLRDARVQQTTMFVAPVILLFCEWWLVDLIASLLTPRPK